MNEEVLAHWGLLCLPPPPPKKKKVKALQINNKRSIIYQEFVKIILHSILVVNLSVHVQQEKSCTVHAFYSSMEFVTLVIKSCSLFLSY
jgi:hypothetical protein